RSSSLPGGTAPSSSGRRGGDPLGRERSQWGALGSGGSTVPGSPRQLPDPFGLWRALPRPERIAQFGRVDRARQLPRSFRSLESASTSRKDRPVRAGRPCPAAPPILSVSGKRFHVPKGSPSSRGSTVPGSSPILSVSGERFHVPK